MNPMTDLRPTIITRRDPETWERTTTVRYWSVYRQQWITCEPHMVPDEELAGMDADDRDAIRDLRP